MKRILAAILCVTILIFLCSCSILNNKTRPQNIDLTENFEPDEKFDTCYFTLNENQQKMYKVLYSCALEMPKNFVKITELYDGAERDLDIAYTALVYDNPEFFWMPTTYVFATAPGIFSDSAAVAFEYSDENMDFDYLVSKEERDEMQKSLNDKIDEIVENAPKTDEFECQVYFDELICKKVEYDEENELANTVYGALVEGKAMCEGYAKSYKLLCNMLGIECELTVGSGKGDPHMWNTVCVDGEYVYTDVTWDDLGDYSSFAYFNIDEATILKDHKIEPLFSEVREEALKSKELYNFNLRKCNTLENTYYAKKGFILSDDFTTEASRIITENTEHNIMQQGFFVGENIEKVFRYDKEGFVEQIQSELENIEITEYVNINKVLILLYEIVPMDTESVEGEVLIN